MKQREPSEILERIQGFDIVVTKEMPVSGDIIRPVPGFGEIDLRSRHGIQQSGSGGGQRKGDYRMQRAVLQHGESGPHSHHDDHESQLIHAQTDCHADRK